MGRPELRSKTRGVDTACAAAVTGDKPKADLQHSFTAIAVNIERLSGLSSADDAPSPDFRPRSRTFWTSAGSLI
ncbi:hypothetical protein OG417_39570 [Actinoallomurus sp. NBC_01490]|jgi:hypothetical protein|uniref:hypothetical protein n=1 Tax=Actinoallomurus sp. NBC_01490 TaxID=2903557 RepID=UPI002E2FDF91|nr:hypothetical protein [Actinoallomurus sp. NBC_01490]